MKATVSEKGQVTIPKSVRESMGLRPGTTIDFHTQGGKLIGVKSEAEDVFKKWRGRAKLPEQVTTVDEYLRLVRDES